MGKRKLDLGAPNPRQREFFLARERFVAYGGARGGGKSWAVRQKAVAGALCWPGIRILIVRRTYPELEATLIRPLVAAVTRPGREVAKYRGERRVVEFFNGSLIRFGHLALGNLGEYQGQEYDWVFLDEATQFTQEEFRTLGAVLRGTTAIPRRMYLTCNPGGIGHQWVKRLFIDRRYVGREDPADYRFIPATVEDNKALLEHSPEYVEFLELLPESLRRGHRYGDWSAFEGQFFPEFDVGRHVAPVTPQPGWRLYRAIDYGLDMFACLWIGVDGEGRYYVYREVQEPGLIVSQAAELAKRLTPEGEEILCTAAPPDLWSTQKDTGRTMAELFGEKGLPLVRVSSARAAGWMAVKEALREGADGRPGLLIDPGCRGLIENLQALRFSAQNPSDCDTNPHSITHICDALRYFCALRPGGEWETVQPMGSWSYIYYGMEEGA